MKSNGFVFYRSMWDSYLELSRKDEKLAEKFLKAVIEYGLDGEYDESDPIVNALMSGVTIGIDNAHNRYNTTQDNGNKGGRPKSYSAERMIELLNEGKTYKQIADVLDCSIKTVQRTLKEARTAHMISDNTEFKF